MTTLNVTVEAVKGHVAIGRQETDGVLPLDRPVGAGGTGLGFNGGHLMLLGWGACFKSTLVAAAQARDIPIAVLRLDISGDVVSGPSRFETVRMRVVLEGPDTREDREKLVTIAANGCIVSNTLKRGAAMEITLDA